MMKRDEHAEAYGRVLAITSDPMARGLPCTDDADRFLCARQATLVASSAGLPMRVCVEVALAAAELASNAARHGEGGVLYAFAAPGRVELVCVDRGPGLVDPERALRDGFSQGRDTSPLDPPRGGLGTGLGAVRRAMNELRFFETPGGGLTVYASRIASRQ